MMKWIAAALMLCVTMVPSWSQHHGMGSGGYDNHDDDDGTETLASSGSHSTGGFGAAVLKVGPFNNGTQTFLGVRGGWVIDQTFVIGGGLYGTTDLITNSMMSSSTTNRNIAFGYGGLELEYLIAAKKLIHGSVITHFGIGSFYGNDDYYYSYPYYTTRSSTAKFVFEPSANAELNIMRWLRLSLGVGYRFVTGESGTGAFRNYDNNSVQGPFGVLQIKFGSY